MKTGNSLHFPFFLLLSHSRSQTLEHRWIKETPNVSLKFPLITMVLFLQAFQIARNDSTEK